MPAVVTGASGLVGANLVRALLARGERVRALVHHDRRALEGLDVETAAADICEPASITAAMHGADVVYHAAAQVSILRSERDAIEQVNVQGTRNVVDACLRGGVRRLVHFSSIEAFAGRDPDAIIYETSERTGPEAGPYARSKVAGEAAVREGMARGLDAVILNPTAIIGPHDYRVGPLSEAVLRLATGSLPFLVQGGFNWVDVRDVAEGAIEAAMAAQPGAQYILGGHWVSLRDLGALLEEVTGAPAPRWYAPMTLARFGAPFITTYSHLTGRRALYTSESLRPLRGYRRVSHEHATADLGYRPRPLEETIVDTIGWLEEEGFLVRKQGQPRPTASAC